MNDDYDHTMSLAYGIALLDITSEYLEKGLNPVDFLVSVCTLIETLAKHTASPEDMLSAIIKALDQTRLLLCTDQQLS